MEVKKREESSQLTVWIVASILLHLLIMLIVLLWHLEHLFKFKQLFQQQPQVQKEQPKQVPDLQKMKLNDPSVSYQLIPGRKAVTTPQTDIPKPKEEPKPIEKKQEPIPEKTVKPAPIELPKTATPQQKAFKLPHDYLETLKQKLTKQHIDSVSEEKVQVQPKEKTANDDEPTIQKKKVTLQDLKLGFAKYLQEGNNDILIQNGKGTPDAKALRYITYNQHVARTMKEAIMSHEQWNRITKQFGKRVRLNLTLNRAGKLLDLKIIQGSGDQLLDKITLESLQAIKLYPPVPQHIPEDPFTMPWTLLF